MFSPLVRAPLYNITRRTGNVRLLPINLTFSVSYHCNSRCLTCNVWRKHTQDFTLEEYEQTFRRLGATPYWFTFSGGEPFLRADLIDIILAAYRHCRPGIINIPTNGLLVKRVVEGVDRLTREAPKAKIVINLSLDGIGERHDELRGVPGNYAKLRETYAGLRQLAASNLTVGLHTVISQFNIDEFIPLHQHIRQAWQPDSFITELAEERVELDTIGLDITPPAEKYKQVTEYLVDDIDTTSATGVAGLAQAFRRHYYQLAHRTLAEQRQVLPCYAGVASAHIAPNGDVWTCCIRAEPIGNLREVDYDLRPIWQSRQADELRRSIRRGDCYCPLANAAYSSMLCDPPSLWQVGKQLVKSKLSQLSPVKEVA